MKEFFCAAPSETQALAARLAPHVGRGDVVVLVGALGAGKTLFAGGLAGGLGVDEQVISPSYVLVRQYESGLLPVFHVDVYRLSSFNEFDDLGVFEIARDGVLIIEWGDAIEGALPDDHLRIELQVEDDGARRIRLIPMGDWQSRSLDVLP